VGPALELQLAEFGMEQVDLKTVTGDDQSFRMYVVMGLSALSQRVAGLEELAKAASEDAAHNRDRLVQIDRVAKHEAWIEDLRKEFSDHAVHCPVGERMTATEGALRAAIAESAARAEVLKGLPELQKQVQELARAAAEHIGAKGQKESDWRTTLIMIGMAVSTLLSLISLFKKG
jgi:hypothetical protein